MPTAADTSHDPDMPTGDHSKRGAVAGELDSEQVIANRAGEVLIKHTVLKADHFPSKYWANWPNSSSSTVKLTRLLA